MDNLEAKCLEIINKLYLLCPQYDERLNSIMKEKMLIDINSVKLNKVDIIPLLKNKHISLMFEFLLSTIKSKLELENIRKNLKLFTLYKEKIEKINALKTKKASLLEKLKEKKNQVLTINKKKESLLEDKQLLYKDYKQIIKNKELVQSKLSILKASEQKLITLGEEFKGNPLEEIINSNNNSNSKNFISEQTNEEMYREFLTKNVELVNKSNSSDSQNSILIKKLPVIGTENLGLIPFLNKNNSGYITTCIINHLENIKINIETTKKEKEDSKNNINTNTNTNNKKAQKKLDSKTDIQEIIYLLINKFDQTVLDYQKKLSIS